MTVAESLRDKLRYNMMMNHDSIEVSDKIFGFDTPAQRKFNSLFRAKAFELAVKHNVDLIFTYVCAFDMKEDIEYLESLKNLFEQTGGHFFFVELKATLEERLFRNETPHRMERKASKKDVAWSKANLMQDAENHKLNTDEGERCFENHMKKNTALAYEIAPHRMARKKAYGAETKNATAQKDWNESVRCRKNSIISSKQAYQTTIKETPYENKRRSPNLRYVFPGHLSGGTVS